MVRKILGDEHDSAKRHRALFDYLEGGVTLDEFLGQFPSVKRDQAAAELELARATLMADVRSS
jgi:hypothetical protein